MKNRFSSLVIVALFGILALIINGACDAKDEEKVLKTHSISYFWNFEDVPVGELPSGWKVEATGRQSPLATWQVQEDRSAPSGIKVLGLVKTNHHSGGTFNLCWTDRVNFLNGQIEVAFKPVKGRIDQGGGIMWRVQDRNNYYVARFNPLEDNFRIYYVKHGIRRMIQSARISLKPQMWHKMKIVQNGDKYQCYLNGKKLLEGKDSHFKHAGGVGLWTKADAVTSFDDFKVATIK